MGNDQIYKIEENPLSPTSKLAHVAILDLIYATIIRENAATIIPENAATIITEND